MKFSMMFEVSEEALEEVGGSYAMETERVTTAILAKMRHGFTSGPVYDINGNRIGEWKVEK